MYRFFRASAQVWFDRLVDIATFISAALVFWALGGVGITHDTAFIPTITNGITATTSIVVAGTGLVLTFANAHKLIQRNKVWADRVYYTLCFVLVSIGFVFLAYFGLMSGEYVVGIRTAMMGMIIASGTFANFTFFVLRRYIEPTLPK
jgi:hypothetical protein